MSDVVLVAIIGGCSTILVAVIPLIANRITGGRNTLAKVSKDMDALLEWKDGIGDIVYQMLDHMATSNNTGNMKRALDTYNAFNRHK